MTRIRRPHVHIRVIDPDQRVRSYPCVPELAKEQIKIEREWGHRSVTYAVCVVPCLGFEEDPPELPAGRD